MSLYEPRCMVCGAPFENTVRRSEVCSDNCYEIYMLNPDTGEVEYEEKTND